jgi:hypothetical protein
VFSWRYFLLSVPRVVPVNKVRGYDSTRTG